MRTPDQKQVSDIIRNHVALSIGAGLVPIPLIDSAAVYSVQIDMIKKLCGAYDVNFELRSLKASIATLTTSTLARTGARAAVKLIPGAGSVIGGMALGAFSGASTYALAQVTVKHFDSGGTMMNFEPAKYKKYFEEQLDKGKKYISQWTKSKSPEDNTVEDIPSDSPLADVPKSEMAEIIAQLENLANMRAKGLISEVEFENLKQRLLAT